MLVILCLAGAHGCDLPGLEGVQQSSKSPALGEIIVHFHWYFGTLHLCSVTVSQDTSGHVLGGKAQEMLGSMLVVAFTFQSV